MKWKDEYFSEYENFSNKEKRQISDKFLRLIWIKELEEEHNFDIRNIDRVCRPLFIEAKNCFIQYVLRGSITVMETALSAMLFRNLDVGFFEKKWPNSTRRRINQKTKEETIVEITDTRIIIFHKLIELAKEEGLISKKLAKELHIFRWIRNGVVHHELIQKSHLGSRWESYRGEGTKSLGNTFLSPFPNEIIKRNGKKEKKYESIKLYSLFEGAQKGFIEFFNLYTELINKNPNMEKK
ncbi:MAG: hypothetical protein HGN29_10875 [Asgard group archaeon]|nr:hypothetical protein [Asgard group archaeon]